MYPVARMICVLIAATWCTSAGAQESALPSTSSRPVERSPDHRIPLTVLIDAALAGDQEAADELLRAAYEAAPGARTRTHVFQEAAKAAAIGGSGEQALAWADWAVLESASAGAERRMEALTAAIDVAAHVGARRAALDHARAFPALHSALDDRSDRRAALISHLGVFCPDLAGERHVRRSVEVSAPKPGVAFREPTVCRYASLRGASASEMLVYAVMSWQDIAQAARSAAGGRFGWFEDANPPHIRGGQPRRAIVKQVAAVGSQPTWLVSTEYARRGEPHFTRAYAMTARSGVMIVTSGVATDTPWPPDALNTEVLAVLRSVRALDETL